MSSHDNERDVLLEVFEDITSRCKNASDRVETVLQNSIFWYEDLILKAGRSIYKHRTVRNWCGCISWCCPRYLKFACPCAATFCTVLIFVAIAIGIIAALSPGS